MENLSQLLFYNFFLIVTENVDCCNANFCQIIKEEKAINNTHSCTYKKTQKNLATRNWYKKTKRAPAQRRRRERQIDKHASSIPTLTRFELSPLGFHCHSDQGFLTYRFTNIRGARGWGGGRWLGR